MTERNKLTGSLIEESDIQRDKKHEHSHDHHHGHHHCHGHFENGITVRLIVMIVLTAVFFLVELICGFVTKSLALQSDAFHMFTDLFSLIVGLVAHKLKERPPTKTLTFGYQRTETVGALFNAIFMIAIIITIFMEAIERFIVVHEIKEPVAFLIVGILGLLVNLIGIFIFHNHTHDNNNIKGIFLHILGDFLGSIGVIISACVVQFTDWKYKFYVDPAISLLIVLMLAYSSTKLFLATSRVVLEACPDEINVDDIKSSISKVNGVSSVKRINVWQLSENDICSAINIIIEHISDQKRILESVQNILMSFKIYNNCIQIESEEDHKEHSEECCCHEHD